MSGSRNSRRYSESSFSDHTTTPGQEYSGGGFDRDAEQFKASGNPKADDYIFPDYREGWKV